MTGFRGEYADIFMNKVSPNKGVRIFVSISNKNHTNIMRKPGVYCTSAIILVCRAFHIYADKLNVETQYYGDPFEGQHEKLRTSVNLLLDRFIVSTNLSFGGCTLIAYVF